MRPWHQPTLPLLLLAVPAFFCSCGNGKDQAQSRAVLAFYDQIIPIKEGGIPSQSTIDRLAPLVSRSFTVALRAGLAAEARHARRVRNAEPPLVEGALFYSLFEGADRIKAVTPDRQTVGNAFLVSLEYGDPRDPMQFTQWQDRVYLSRERGRWVVDDLELLGGWPFGRRGRLKRILNELALNEPEQPAK